MKVEGGESVAKGVKREREESKDDDIIEIFSDDEDEDLESLQVIHATPRGSQTSDCI